MLFLLVVQALITYPPDCVYTKENIYFFLYHLVRSASQVRRVLKHSARIRHRHQRRQAHKLATPLSAATTATAAAGAATFDRIVARSMIAIVARSRSSPAAIDSAVGTVPVRKEGKGQTKTFPPKARRVGGAAVMP
jgi:hypothetical protein